MAKNGLVFVVLSIALGLALTWFHTLWNEQKEFIRSMDKSKIDYYLSDFSLYTTDQKGKMQYSIAGEHLVHHHETKSSEIYKPAILVSTPTNSLSLSADKVIHDASGNLLLKGETIVQKPIDNENAGFILLTTDLKYSPSKQTVSTDADMTFNTTDGIKLSGTGFSEDIESMITRLKSNVHAEYTP
jgi:LPS export ABC transporter protein LptC